MAASALKTRRPNRRGPVALREDFQPGPRSPLKVDRDKRIIYRVKILGWDSANGRRYDPDGAKAGLRLYEGKKAYCNHRKRPGEARDVNDVLGIWHDPTFEPDGVYCDLHYVAAHPMAERVAEDAERGLGAYGFSHDADGQGENRDGVFVVRAITEVRSVDLVADPASVKNLWESTQDTPMPKTLRQLITGNAKIDKTARKALLEAGDAMGGAPMDADLGPPPDAPAPPPPEDVDYKTHLVNAISALVNSEDPADHELAKKIMAMLKPKSADDDLEEEDDTAGEKGGAGDGSVERKTKEECDAADKEKKVKEARENRRLRRELDVRDLLENAALTFGKPEARKAFIASLLPLDDASRKTLIEERKATQGNGHARGPRSQAQGAGVSVTESKAAPADAKDFASRLLNA